jgi:NAD(P)-dependent dehydrogenase (short-subunit alcohol dehydrogenase family)
MASQEFQGKVAIVTGASRGIGRALALGLAERGASVVVSARRLESSSGDGGTLAETVAMIKALGAPVLAAPAEIVTEQGPQYIAQRAAKEFGRVDILINNAGTYPDAAIAEQDFRQWRDALAINLTAPFLMAKAVIPHMVAAGGGSILNVSSGSSLNYSAGRVAYATAKAGLNTFSAFLAEELRGDGIAVNAWMPGLISTDMSAQKGEDPSVCVPGVMWAVAQTPATFTGQVVRRRDFGDTWGPKA